MAGDRKLKLEILLKAIDAATKPFRGVEQQVDKTSAALQAHGRELIALKAQQKDVAAFRTYRRELDQTRDALREAQTRAQALAREHAQAEAPTRKMTRALDAARREVNQLETAEQKHVLRLNETRQRLNEAGVSTRNLSTHERDLRRRIQQTTDAMQEQDEKLKQLNARRDQMATARQRYDKTQALAGSMQGAGMSAIGAGAAVGAPIVLAAQQAMGFEEAMADVRKVVDFPTPAVFKTMSNDLLDLSTRLPVAKEELAAIMAQGARAGVARQDLLAYTEAAAKMGVAFDVSSEEAGAMMATWRTAFGMAQPEVIALADRVNALTNAYGGNAAAVSEMITRVGPLADVAGASGPHLAALAQVMNSVGVQSEIGATGIKNMLLGLTKGEAATKSQAKAFAALGMDASEMAKRMQTDASGAIMSVLDAVAALPKEQGLAVLTQLFGSESVAAISPLLSQLELVRRNFRQVGDASFYAGSMDKEYAARAETTANAVALAKNGVGALATEIGYGLLPQIQAFSAWASTTARGVRDFAAAHPQATRVVATLVATLAGALFLFGGFAIAIAGVLGPFALMRLSFVQAAPVLRALGGGFMFVARWAQWTGVALGGRLLTAIRLARTAMLGFNLALLANPITWIVVGVVALAAAAFLIWKNWSKIGPWLAGVWETVKAVVAKGIEAVVGFLMKWTLVGVIARNWDAVVAFLGSVWTLIKEVVGLGLDSLKLAILTFTPLGFIMRNWAPVTTFIGNLWSTARRLVDAGIAAIGGAIASWAPLQAFQQAFASVFSWMSGLPAQFLKFGTDIIKGLTAGIRGQRAAVQQASADAAGQAETSARRRLDTHSPSRVFAAIGRDLMDGFSLGITGRAGRPAEHMRRAAAALAAAGAVGLPAAAGASALGANPIQFETGPRLTSAAGSRSAGPAPVNHFEFHIHGAPGQSEQKLAELVAAEVAKVMGGPGPDGGGSFEDDPDDA